MSVTRIEVKDLVVRYGDQAAVNGVSFTVGRGEHLTHPCRIVRVQCASKRLPEPFRARPACDSLKRGIQVGRDPGRRDHCNNRAGLVNQ